MTPDDHTAPHPTDVYAVPQDPMDELQCDSCQ